jgi:hypothetical protein
MGPVLLPNPGHPPDETQLQENATELNDKKDNDTANANRMTFLDAVPSRQVPRANQT